MQGRRQGEDGLEKIWRALKEDEGKVRERALHSFRDIYQKKTSEKKREEGAEKTAEVKM